MKKTSSFLNSPQMGSVRGQLLPPEASPLDGALSALRAQREREAEQLARQEEAARHQALIQAARDTEREMIQYLAQEAADQRRLAHEAELASVRPEDLHDEALRAIHALPPKESSGGLDDEIAYTLAIISRRTKASSTVRDAALVGYETPDGGVREVYLENTAPQMRDRLRRAMLVGGAGMVGGALGGAVQRLVLRRGSNMLPMQYGAIGGGAGALVGALLPHPVRRAYDPDYGTELSNKEERRAAAVQRALRPGDQPGNVAMADGSESFRPRTFGGTPPGFAYAADVDDLISEDPEMADYLLGKTSAAPYGMNQTEPFGLSQLRLTTDPAEHPQKAEVGYRSMLPAYALGTNDKALLQMAVLDQAQQAELLREVAAYQPRGTVAQLSPKTPEEIETERQQTFLSNRARNSVLGAVGGGALGAFAGSALARTRPGLGTVTGTLVGASALGVLARALTNKNPYVDPVRTDTLFEGDPNDAYAYFQERLNKGSEARRLMPKRGVKSAWDKLRRYSSSNGRPPADAPFGNRKQVAR